MCQINILYILNLYSVICQLYFSKAGKIKKERDTCTPMFIAALFTIARTWKQPRCPLAGEWIRKLWYIHTMYIVNIY